MISMSRLALLPILLMTAGFALAQGAGSVSGVLADASGSPKTGTEVTATNQDTGRVYHAMSGTNGAFAFPDVDPGAYTFEAGDAQVKDVTVHTATRTFVDLRPGQNGGASSLEKASSELGSVVDQTLYSNLPILVRGTLRSPQDPIAFLPGVNNGPRDSSIVGGAIQSKEVLLNGLTLASPASGTHLNRFPFPEQIREMRLITGAPQAEYGRSGGGVEVYTLNSGTNMLHGSAYDYLRNDALEAAGWATNSFKSRKPSLKQNEYGITLGGPVVIPDVYDGRNKTFFNFAYTQFRTNNQTNQQVLSVPTIAARNGDYTNLLNAAGQQILIYNPDTTRDTGRGLIRDVFTANRIPASRLSSVSQKIINYIPQPDNNRATNNYLGQNKINESLYSWSGRLEKVISSTRRLSGFANMEKHDALNSGPLPAALSNGNLTYSRPQVFQGSYEQTRGSNITDRFSLGYLRYETHWDRVQEQRQNWSKLLGLNGIASGETSTFPVITFSDGLTPYGRYTDFKTVGGQYDRVIELRYDSTRIFGQHEAKIGLDGRSGRSFQKPLNETGVQGQFAFANLQTALPAALSTTGYSFASFMLGAPNSGARSVVSQGPDMHYNYGALYLQDNFRMSAKLTLNIGFRYDLPGAGYDANEFMSSFDPNLANSAAGGLKGAIAFAGKGTGRIGRKAFGEFDKTEIAPRIGLAYSFDGKTVIRGGWAMIYSAGNQLTGNSCTLCFVGATARIQQNSNGLDPAFAWDQGLTPQAGYKPPPSLDPTVANGTSVFFISPDSGKAPRIQNFSLSVQREVMRGLIIDASYLGTRARRLSGALPLNQSDPKYLAQGALLGLSITDPKVVAAGFRRPYASFNGTLAQSLRPYPQFGDITDHYGARFESDYDSFQLKATRNFGDLHLIASFVYSKATSDGSSSQSATTVLAPQNAYNLAAEGSYQLYDIPRTLNLQYSWDLPFGKGKMFGNSANKHLTMLASGWTFSAQQVYRSGSLLLVNAPNTIGDGVIFASRRRANSAGSNLIAGGVDPNSGSPWISPGAFAIPAPYTFGNAANFYDDLRNPKFTAENFSLIKRTPVNPMLNLEYRIDMFNAFNRALLGNVNTTLGDPNFGRTTGQMISPRIVQMALRLHF